MTSRDYCYWLQGFFELNQPEAITEAQLQIIKNHLNLVFIHDIDVTERKEAKISPELQQALHGGSLMLSSSLTKANC